jgi:predicted HicB family RNase H-like nuclease
MPSSFLVEIEGYRARVERERDGTLHGRVLEMEEIIQFRASTMRMIETKFANALESYFVFCRERGIEPKKPAGPAF